MSLLRLESMDPLSTYQMTVPQLPIFDSRDFSQNSEDIIVTDERYLIAPGTLLHNIWGFVLLYLIVYILIIMPLTIAFENHPQLIDYISDMLFLADIVVLFFTPFKSRKDVFVVSKRKIARRYLCSWFLLDLVVFFPYYLIFPTSYNMLARVTYLIKLPRLFSHSLNGRPWISILSGDNCQLTRLSGVFQFTKTERFIHDAIVQQWHKIKLHPSFSPAILRIVQLVMISAIFAHFSAGIWIRIGEDTIGETWLTRAFNGVDASFSEQYQRAIYFSYTTLTTVGYGDIVPVSDNGRAFADIIISLGVMFYAYVTASVAITLQSFNNTTKDKHQKDVSLRKFLTDSRFPKDLNKKVLGQFRRSANEKNTDYSQEIVRTMPANLRRRVTQWIHRDLIASCDMFKSLNSQFTASLLARFKPEYFSKGDRIAVKGDVVFEWYFVKSGSVEAFEDDKYNIRLKRYGPGTTFGESGIFITTKWEVSLRADSDCELMMVSRRDLFRAMSDFPEVRHSLIQRAQYSHADLLRRIQNIQQLRHPSYRLPKKKSVKQSKLPTHFEVSPANSNEVTEPAVEMSSLKTKRSMSTGNLYLNQTQQTHDAPLVRLRSSSEIRKMLKRHAINERSYQFVPDGSKSSETVRRQSQDSESMDHVEFEAGQRTSDHSSDSDAPSRPSVVNHASSVAASASTSQTLTNVLGGEAERTRRGTDESSRRRTLTTASLTEPPPDVRSLWPEDVAVLQSRVNNMSLELNIVHDKLDRLLTLMAENNRRLTAYGPES
eukprot:472257_1